MNSSLSIAVQTTYPVMEAFYTLQGEGSHSGKAAYFIRLGGCDVGCVWCDVKDSWDAGKHPVKTVDEILATIYKQLEAEAFNLKSFHPNHTKPIIVITGGEPLMHDLTMLTNVLHKAGFVINIETSGTSPLSGEIDWICLSPKKFKAPLPEVIPVADELKIVVFNKTDFTWAEQFAAQVSPACKLFLQPEWDKREQMTPLIVAYIKKHPQWQMSLQTHKYIGVP